MTSCTTCAHKKNQYCPEDRSTEAPPGEKTMSVTDAVEEVMGRKATDIDECKGHCEAS